MSIGAIFQEYVDAVVINKILFKHIPRFLVEFIMVF